MKGWVLIVVVVVLIVLVILAWRKESLPEPKFGTEGENEKEGRNLPPFSFHRPSKAKKTRAPHTKEERWRDFFEQITGHAYPNTRPFWLVNPETGRKLELDGYAAELGSAFEYNGRQHYEFPNSFHKTREEFDRQVERDILKEKTCREMGVDLIIIPYDLEIEDTHPDILRRLAKVMKRYKERKR